MAPEPNSKIIAAIVGAISTGIVAGTGAIRRNIDRRAIRKEEQAALEKAGLQHERETVLNNVRATQLNADLNINENLAAMNSIRQERNSPADIAQVRRSYEATRNEALGNFDQFIQQHNANYNMVVNDIRQAAQINCEMVDRGSNINIGIGVGAQFGSTGYSAGPAVWTRNPQTRQMQFVVLPTYNHNYDRSPVTSSTPNQRVVINERPITVDKPDTTKDVYTMPASDRQKQNYEDRYYTTSGRTSTDAKLTARPQQLAKRSNAVPESSTMPSRMQGQQMLTFMANNAGRKADSVQQNIHVHPRLDDHYSNRIAEINTLEYWMRNYGIRTQSTVMPQQFANYGNAAPRSSMIPTRMQGQQMPTFMSSYTSNNRYNQGYGRKADSARQNIHVNTRLDDSNEINDYYSRRIAEINTPEYWMKNYGIRTKPAILGLFLSGGLRSEDRMFVKDFIHAGYFPGVRLVESNKYEKGKQYAVEFAIEFGKRAALFIAAPVIISAQANSAMTSSVDEQMRHARAYAEGVKVISRFLAHPIDNIRNHFVQLNMQREAAVRSKDYKLVANIDANMLWDGIEIAAVSAGGLSVGYKLAKPVLFMRPANRGGNLGGAGNTNKFIEAAEKFLGKDFHISKPIKGSDLIMRSKDGLRQIRFDISNPHGLKPHINIETFEPRNLFPGDKRLNRVENLHVFPGEKLVEKKTNEQIINGIGKPSF